MLTADQLRNERQVGDLSGGPAELKDDDERAKVGQTGPLWGVRAAAHTLVEDEAKGQQHAQRTWRTHPQEMTLSITEVKQGWSIIHHHKFQCCVKTQYQLCVGRNLASVEIIRLCFGTVIRRCCLTFLLRAFTG